MRHILLYILIIVSPVVYANNAQKILLLGASEHAKEIALELHQLGVETVAIDTNNNAPAMNIANHAHIITSIDSDTLYPLIQSEKPSLIISDITKIKIDTLKELETQGYTVTPSAHAASIVTNRERIKSLAEKLQFNIATYTIVHNADELSAAVNKLGTPCIAKSIKTASTKQVIIQTHDDTIAAWKQLSDQHAVVVEQLIDFDYEITLLITLQKNGGPRFCDPIGHRYEKGQFVESWQPHPMSHKALRSAITIATQASKALGGAGTFAVKMFVKNDEVYFNTISAGPHDAGMVTYASQDLSEFAIHTRALLELPLPHITLNGPAASYALRTQTDSSQINYRGVHLALEEPETRVRLFSTSTSQQCLGVALARGETLDEARERAQKVAIALKGTW